MQLSLWILKNWLADFDPELRISPTMESPDFINEIGIEKARLYNGFYPLDDTTVYTGTSHQFFGDEGRQVVCRFRGGDLLLASTDITLVFNQILNAFYYYESWENRMNLLMAEQCSLTELLDASDEILMNPLLIFDSSDAIIAASTSYLHVEVDEHWYELLSLGGTFPDKSVDFHKQSSALFDHRNHRPYYIPTGFFPNGSWSQNIFRQEEWCGICVVVEYRQPLDTGMLHLFYLFSQMIQRYTNTRSEHNAFKLQSAFFLEALEGQDPQTSGLRRRLLANGWNSQDSMILLRVVPLSPKYHTHTYLCRIFSGYSPYLFPAAMNHEILLLCNISKLLKQDLFSFLGPWLKNSYYRCGVSQPFSDLNQLSTAHKQSGIALQYGEQTAGSIHEVRDHMIFWLTEALKDRINPLTTHPALLQLREHDQKNHTDYYRTLFIYLKNERNSQMTAAQLNIHRNTLFHRLERIKELFCLDLNLPEERFYLMLSFYCNPPGDDSASQFEITL